MSGPVSNKASSSKGQPRPNPLPPTIVTILKKVWHLDAQGHIFNVFRAPSERLAGAYLARVIGGKDFTAILVGGQKLLSDHEKGTLVNYFSELSAKYPELGLTSAVGSIISKLN